MAEAAEPDPKFDCPEGLKCPEGVDGDNLEYGHDRVKYYDYIKNDEFMRKTKDENGVCVKITIHIISDKTYDTHNLKDRINKRINDREEIHVPYLWQTYHLYTLKMPPCDPDKPDKLAWKRSLNCCGYLKDKS